MLLSYLGDLAVHLDDLLRAQQLFEESSALLTRIRYMLAMPWPVRRLAHIARLRGDLPSAVRLCVQSMNINLEMNEVQGVAASLVALAQVADTAEQPEFAVQLLGKADAVVGPSGPQLLPFDRGQHELITARLRSKVEQPTWDQAWNIGRQLSLDDAVRLSESLAETAPAANDLTERQREILRLLAMGATNREIAECLTLSVATVERHLANIYIRIGAKGRAAATLYAMRGPGVFVLRLRALGVHVYPQVIASAPRATHPSPSRPHDRGLDSQPIGGARQHQQPRRRGKPNSDRPGHRRDLRPRSSAPTAESIGLGGATRHSTRNTNWDRWPSPSCFRPFSNGCCSCSSCW